MTTPPASHVALRPMRDDEFASFRDAFIRAWAKDLRRVDGLSADEALAESTRLTDGGLYAGLATPGVQLFVIEADGRRAGTLWLELDHRGNAHIADITIDEPLRGRGYGRRALELAEEHAARAGASSIALNVYDDNHGARRLYESLGYRPTRHTLRKRLGR